MRQIICMLGMHRNRLALAILVAAVALLHAPRSANAQLLKRIKKTVAEHTTKKVVEHQAQAETTVVKAADKATDSTLTKSNRGLTAVVTKTGAVVDTGLNRSQSAIEGLWNPGAARDRLRSDLATGRAVLHGVVFAAESAELLPSSDEALQHLASILGAMTGAFLVEGHVDSSTSAALSQSLSEARAATVKGRLVSFGIAESRLFAVGFGTARPLDSDVAHSARIEIAKLR